MSPSFANGTRKFQEEETANVHDVARNYWWIYLQPKSAWSNEVELRLLPRIGLLVSRKYKMNDEFKEKLFL